MEKRTRKYVRIQEGTHQIEFRADTEEIKAMFPLSADEFWYSIACTSCSHVMRPIRIDLKQKNADDGTDDKVNWLAVCPDCKKDMTIAYVENYIEQTYQKYSDWNPLWEVTCKGCRIDVVGCDKWKVVSTTGNEYEWDSSADFYEFDEKLGRPIGVVDLDFYVRTLE